MTYRLALDIGANSIGWCLFTLDASEPPEPIGIRDIGVRVFPDGREAKTNASLAAARRAARQMRRRRDRYLQRRAALLNTLTRWGLMPAATAERAAVAALDPYVLRDVALTRRLEAFELGRAIFHLNQRRGFRSNRTIDRSNQDEKGKIKQGGENLAIQIARGNFATLGAWLAERHAKRAEVRARLRGTGMRAAYPFYPMRHMIEAEFDTIWTAQAAWNPALSAPMRAEIHRVLFSQRNLRKPLVGRCWLEPTQDRAPRALPSTQAFRIAQDLANLAIRRPGEPDQRPTDQQRALLFDLLMAGHDQSFGQMRELLGLSRREPFNLESRARDGLKGSATATRLAGKKGPLRAVWTDLPLLEQDEIVRILLEAEGEEAVAAALARFAIRADAAAAAADMTLPDGHGSLSTKAITAILPHLLAGNTYDAAVQLAGYAHHSDDRDGVIRPCLPYYGEILGERLGTGSGKPEDSEERRFGRAPNPTVHVALNQLRIVVNTLIERYGPPAQVVVEVLRELAQSAHQRALVEKEQAENAKRRAGWVKQLEELRERPNGRNLAFMRLWHEQAEDPKDRVCPYTGRLISLELLFSGEVEEDHILPYAVTLDDSFANRVLVTREANRRKGRQTPHKAFGGSPEWPDIQARIKALPGNKAWRFAPGALEKWRGEHGDFLARHLTDSAYLARLARLYLRAVCDPDQVWVVPGRLTGMLRGVLGLNSATLLGKGGARKERNDHRHHAIDALTIGLIDRSLLQRVATAARRAEDSGRRLMEDVEPPWPGFVAEAAARVRGIVVSFRPDTAPAGQLHNATAYRQLIGAGKGEPNVAHRVPIQSLAGWSAEDVTTAVPDPDLRARILGALAADGKPAQAAALAQVAHDPDSAVRHIQVRERLDGTAAIKDRRTGRPYKLVKLDANHRVEIWRLPGEPGAPARPVMCVIALMQAAMDAELARLGRPVPDRRPHPAARLLMRLHKGDVVAFGNGAGRRLLRVIKYRSGQVTLATLHEAGNLKARDAEKDDPFKYVNAGVTRFREERARKVFVDPAGRVRDPGPLKW